jgi:hypothetical protein
VENLNYFLEQILRRYKTRNDATLRQELQDISKLLNFTQADPARCQSDKSDPYQNPYQYDLFSPALLSSLDRSLAQLRSVHGLRNENTAV